MAGQLSTDPFTLDESLALESAYSRGLGGASDNLQLIIGSGGTNPISLCRVDVPRSQARTWLVTLTQMRVGGTVPGAPAGFAPVYLPESTINNAIGDVVGDLQTSTGATAASCLKARVQWGTGENIDTCLVDYPWCGTAFRVTGAMVNVDIPPTLPVISPPSGFSLPRIGAFISARDTVEPLRPPTYTTGAFGVAASPASITFVRPKRAWGYKLFMTTTITTAGSFFVYETNVANTVVKADGQMDPRDLLGTPAMTEIVLLHPNATFLRCDNATANALVVGVQWFLDIG